MILDRILKQKLEETAEMTRPSRRMSEALRRGGLSVIGEIKRASPSKGVINGSVDPLKQLRLYEQGGADAVSILTDQSFFGGSADDFRSLRPRTVLPLLRKDFILTEVQVYESLFLGADALLLIAAALERKRLEELLSLAYSLGMEVIAEVHTDEELRSVLDTEAEIIGINNRNLDNFTVDLRTTERLMGIYRQREQTGGRIIVSESGVRTEEDAAFLADTGADAVLVGETLMRSGDPSGLIRAFRKKRSVRAA
ncbi:indole-3-glycerol phosphate synthase TrpC [Aminivibrio sp.]|uniref:indole-3-glycerol phosphate synthase TrpC n=1 Tax=Aminivibrio sp. TaxID=1872489 RepID=UPI001A604359|nr:indole-3-glycerol phosphate synthase TrpC [Aminivibrio sp.]MBL3538143.1 indole-3-glycerol phosphate synthase TrpC [Aminivibrio sp.]